MISGDFSKDFIKVRKKVILITSEHLLQFLFSDPQVTSGFRLKMLSAELRAQAEKFISLLRANPALLHTPDFKFVKDFIESFGGTVPAAPPPSFKPPTDGKPEEPVPPAEPEPESEESEVELDTTGVIEDTEVPEPLEEVNPEAEISEENLEASNAKKQEAITALGENNIETAIELFTEAIKLNPVSALLYAKRGQCYLKINKLNSCVRDCSFALKINPNSAPAYKFRGRANAKLGKWLEAASDLRNACKIDFDETADEWLKEVTPNARKIEEHTRKYERKRAEKEFREKQERIRKAREEHAKAAERSKESSAPFEGEGEEGFPFNDFLGTMMDPEMREMMKDPEVAAAFQDISSNPMNAMKYQSNPKIVKLTQKLAAKFAGGMPGGMPGMPGGMPGFGGPGGPFGGAGGTPPSAPSPNFSDDVGLD